MPDCIICGRDMMAAPGCRVKALEIGGVMHRRKPYEGEGAERCHDCNAKKGELHHLTCDMERCPIHDGQLISCDCIAEILDRWAEAWQA